MNRATSLSRNLARRLLEHETAGGRTSGAKAPAGFDACDKLGRHLATFMGNAGFHNLLARSLALAVAEVPWLRTVRFKADGSYEGLAEMQARLAPEEYAGGGVAVLVHLLCLLAAFIGANLTLRLAREVWPKVPLDDLEPTQEDTNEKAK